MNNITCLVHLNGPNLFRATFSSRYAFHFSNFGISSCHSLNLSLSIVCSTLTSTNILRLTAFVLISCESRVFSDLSKLTLFGFRNCTHFLLSRQLRFFAHKIFIGRQKDNFYSFSYRFTLK